MANNYRLYYAVMQAGVARDGTDTYTAIHGVQQCGISTNFSLENIFELSQLSPYEIKEGTPEIQVTLTKVLDGYPLIYHLLTQGASSGSLAGRSRTKNCIALATFDDTKEAAAGTPIAEVIMSGMFVNSVTYNFPTEGPFTEEVQAVGNNKVWRNTESVSPVFAGAFSTTTADRPYASTGSGGVNVRQHFIFADSSATSARDANGMVTTNATGGTKHFSVFPPDIDGITNSGTNPINSTTLARSAHIQSVQVSVNLNREDLFELSRKTPYYRVVAFPVTVTCSITTLASKWDNVTATELGTNSEGDNLTARTIKIKTTEGTFIDLGVQNKLQSVEFGGGDAQGGNVTLTYNYQTLNDFTVAHPQDPSTSLR
jgi:hypothetical protein